MVSDREAWERATAPKLHLLRQEVRKLREALEWSQRDLASRANFTFQYISQVERPGTNFPSYAIVAAIDKALMARGEILALHAAAKDERQSGDSLSRPSRVHASAKQVRNSGEQAGKNYPVSELAEPSKLGIEQDSKGQTEECFLGDSLDSSSSILATAASNTVLEGIEQQVYRLAEVHADIDPAALMCEAAQLHQRIESLLAGRLRLSQRRDLYRIESELLAHVCILLGDLGRNGAAERAGLLALTYASEAGVSKAPSRSALAKNYRWQNRYLAAADMAQTGYHACFSAPLKGQLASQEANAAALLGDSKRAAEALLRAEQESDHVDDRSPASVWAFPVPRQAVFSQAVARRTSNWASAHLATDKATLYWKESESCGLANWAQIRFGSGLVYLAEGHLDAAISEVCWALRTKPEFRVSTVTGYVRSFLSEISNPHFSSSRIAIDCIDLCRDFLANAADRGGV